MPTYTYTVVDEQGRIQRATLEAASESVVETTLRRQGQWLATITEDRTTASATRRSGRGNLRVPRRVLVEFFMSVGLQLRSGVPLFAALTLGVENQSDGPFQEVHAELLAQVRSGVPLSLAMEAQPKTFEPLVINLIRAGEASGRLTEACEDVRTYFEWVDRMVGDTRQALFYPVFVLTAATGLFFIVFSFLIPRFTGVLKELGVPLPALTRGLIGFSDFMRAHWGQVGLGLLLVGLTLRFGPRLSPAFARALDAVKLRLPVFGPLLHMICLSRLVQNLGTLYRAGIPVLQALDLSRPLIGNRVIEEALTRIRDGVNAGRPLAEAMRGSTVFSGLLIQMVTVGESTGTLDKSLQNVADYYNEVIPRRIKRTFAILEPLITIGLILVVGTVVLAIFLPIAAVLGAK